jgi:hypothetical protein
MTHLYTPLPAPPVPEGYTRQDRYVVMLSHNDVNDGGVRSQLHPVVHRQRPDEAALRELLIEYMQIGEDELDEADMAMFDVDTLQYDFGDGRAEARIVIVEVEDRDRGGGGMKRRSRSPLADHSDRARYAMQLPRRVDISDPVDVPVCDLRTVLAALLSALDMRVMRTGHSGLQRSYTVERESR